MREIQDVAVRELMSAPAVAVRPGTRIEHQAAVIVVTYGDRMIAGFDRV